MEKTISIIVLLFVMSPIFFSTHAEAAPVIPNEAVLMGTVEEYSLVQSGSLGIAPEQILHKITISVKMVADTDDHPNLLRGKEGQSISLYSKEKQPSDLTGQEVKALIEYRGDERGGLFWIKHIETIK
jgi:hypothetical protein